MPPEGLACLSKNELMSDDAIVRFVSIACRLGVTRIRLTGGEPLLRPGVVDLVARLAKVPGLSDLGMTTNGSRLLELALPLKKAGLHRLNISLDSLEENQFKAITLSQMFPQVIAGIAAAAQLGFPIKINVVVLRSMNDDEILDFVRLALRENVAVRFIEFMPLCGTGWKPEMVYPLTEVKKLIRLHFNLTEEDRGDFVAQSFTVSDGVRRANLGFIATLSEPFCDTCSRIRLTADGKIRPCLFSREDFPVLPLLHSGATDDEIAALLRQAVFKKPRGSDYAEYWDRHKVVNLNAYQGREQDTPTIRSIGG